MIKRSLLIIGKLPPPIGGVTIHTSRLIDSVRDDGIPFHFMKLSLKNLFLAPYSINGYHCVHVHTSKPLVRLYFMMLCRIYNKYGIVTIHGDVNRFKSRLKNWIDRQSVKLASKPILLNKRSLTIALKYNENSEMVSSFIPPDIRKERIDTKHIKSIKQMKLDHSFLFCVNAYNLSFDKNGSEIYGILELIEVFKNYPQFGLIFSDPSGAYSKYIKEKNIEISENIYIITGNHSFYRILELTHASIRNTTTDGDSLSVKESLFLKKYTLTTDIVSRPKGCVLYKKGSINETLMNFRNTGKFDVEEQTSVENGSLRLMEIYRQHRNRV